MPKLTEARARYILILLTLLAAGLFLFRIDAKSIWWDESLSLLRAQNDLNYILSNRLDLGPTLTIDQHPPLYFLLLHAVISVWGESDIALKVPSALFATLTVPLLYLLGKRMAGYRVGLIAALWGTLSPMLLWYAQEVRMYTMVTALGALGTYSCWRAVSDRKMRWLVAFAATAILGTSTLHFYWLLLGMQLLYGMMLLSGHRDTRSPLTRRTAILAAGTVILIAVLLLWHAPAPMRALVNEPLPSRPFIPLDEMLLDALRSFSLGLTVNDRETLPAQMVFLIVYVIGLIAYWRAAPAGSDAELWRRSRKANMLMLVAFPIIPLLFFYAVSFFKPLYMGSRYIILFSTSFYLGLALGIEALWHRARPVALAALVLLSAAMIYSDVRYHVHPDYATKEDHRSSAQIVMAGELPGDAVVVTAPENLTAFEHYYEGMLPVTPLPEQPLSMPRADQVASSLQQLTSEYDRLWLVHCRPQWSDPNDLVMQWMDANLLLLERTVLPSYGSYATVALYATRSPIGAAEEQERILATCLEKLALLDWSARYLDQSGHAVTIDRQQFQAAAPAATPPVPGGHALGIRLRWQVLAPLDAFKASLRLVDDGGQVWAHNDDRLIYALPSQEWPTGVAVEHDFSLTLPPGTPPGTYALTLLLYREDGLEPLACPPLAERGELIALGRITVGATPATRTPPASSLAMDEAQRPWPVDGLGPFRVAGSYLGVSAGAAVTPGTTFPLSLWLRATQKAHGDYELVVHWSQGRDVKARQVIPLAGGERQPAEPLLSLSTLGVPDSLPPGTYDLHLLLYDRREAMFLRAHMGILPWPSRALPLGRVTVEAAAGGG